MRPDGEPPGAGPRPLRSDAAANAERVLAAAIRTGLNEGRHVPLAQIAREAGVGVGTLYRRYPSREALLEALEVRAYGLLIDQAEQALASAPTGLAAVEQFLTTSYALRDQLVLPLHGAPWTADTESARGRFRIRELMTEIVRRGQEDGTIRADVTAWTVVRFGSMLAQPMPASPADDEDADEQRRIFLRGISM
ncbi:MAG TPA: TetR/AcrR family transcriptional regulator [Streptosporangiaceae bacterium]|jgi:AcrR family transcriptional regulator|nr:TetR/AcrR family transcriptional regulator [Streptosporangiaceae bacterium]